MSGIELHEARDLWCECQNCTERWMGPRDGVGTIRCPNEECRSKNVEVVDPDA